MSKLNWMGGLTGVWLLALSATVGCSDDEQATADGGGGDDRGGSSSTPEGGEGGRPVEEGVANEHAGEASGGGGEGGAPTKEPLALLKRSVEAQLGDAAVVTDVEALAGKTFELRGYLGPSVDWDGWPGPDNADPDAPDPVLLAAATFHFITDEDDLALVSELPSEIFTHTEQLALQQVNDGWVVRGLTTSVHTAWSSDAFWTTADYESALAFITFADDDGDGTADRVVVAATNGYDGETFRDDGSNVTEPGTLDGVATSEGPVVEAKTVKAVDVSARLPAGDQMSVPAFDADPLDHSVRFGDRAIFAIEPPVAASSVFHLEDSEGNRSELGRIVQNGFVRAVWPKDYLPDGWKLIGSGTAVDGEPFTLEQSVNVVTQAIATGDFESETVWTDFQYCLPNSEILTAYDGHPAIAGTKSLHVRGCPRLRIARAPGATELKLDATGDADVTIDVTAIAPGGSTVSRKHVFVGDAVETITVTLPEEDGDLLVTINGDVWLDSLRTE